MLPASALMPMPPFRHSISQSGTIPYRTIPVPAPSSYPSIGLTRCRTVWHCGINKNVHHACPHFKRLTGVQHARFTLSLVETGTPCMSILQVVKRCTVHSALYTLQVHISGSGKGCTLHVYIACGGNGYTLHIHTAGGVKGYTLNVQTAGGGKKYTLHVHTSCGGKGYTLHVYSAGDGNVPIHPA
jgi:hypothetical protein